MENNRPDPDLLLEAVRKEEEAKKRGKLKIFFGAAPGVGKTYEMLLAARQKRAEGVDVAAGLVETHGRRETEALLEGLELIPGLEIEYRGTILKEFDLDAALARRPGLILVDELAHTNVPGARHPKRWQDVCELLEAGIDVFTTLNVQHIESLNDVIRQITGVTVHETLPDSVIGQADEIELVDLPPDELIQRLSEGKVYVPELAERARENFFRKGNLLALREMALRRTAEQVDARMRRYRTSKGVTAVWPAAERIMVCVSPNPRSINLLRAAKRMADGLHADWMAVHVEAPSTIKPSDEDMKLLDEHMRLAESLGADTATLSGHKSSEEILDYARTRNVTKIIIGKPVHPRWKDKVSGSMLDRLVRDSGDIDIYVISGESEQAEPPRPVPRPPVRHPRSRTSDWLLSLTVVGLCTGLNFLVSSYLTSVDLAMIYILGIVLISIKTSGGPAFAATLLSVMAYDFFFIPPIFTYAVKDARYFVTFLVMFVVASVISRLTLRIREQANASRRRERRITSLYSLSRKLVHEQGMDRLTAAATGHLNELFPGRTMLLLPDGQGALQGPVIDGKPRIFDPKELGVAQWAFDHGQEAGFGTDNLPGAEALYLPLMTSAGSVGVLGILPNQEVTAFEHDQVQDMKSFANQIALAVDRAALAGEAEKALLRAETEALRSTLLSSVSHDLRTPLAAITGAATALLRRDLRLGQEEEQELIRTIQEEADHLNRLIRNVLDMTRLESRAITVKKEWQSIEEIVGAVLDRLTQRLGSRKVAIDIPSDLPLVEQVLMNLLDNTVKYAPDGDPIEVKAGLKDGETLLVEISDHGPGVAPGELEHIFEKFVHGSGGGMGLGLAICRAIINAHGGRIWAENRPDGGAVFRFTLPVEGSPVLPDPEEVEERK